MILQQFWGIKVPKSSGKSISKAACDLKLIFLSILEDFSVNFERLFLKSVKFFQNSFKIDNKTVLQQFWGNEIPTPENLIFSLLWIRNYFIKQNSLNIPEIFKFFAFPIEIRFFGAIFSLLTHFTDSRTIIFQL